VVTKQKISSRHLYQGVLVIAYAALVDRVSWKPATAKEWLDSGLRKRGISNLASGKDIQQWYNQWRAPKGKPAPTLVDTIKSFQPELSNVHTAAVAKALARKCLDLVRDRGLKRIKLRGS
jgi:hypothetical protein